MKYLLAFLTFLIFLSCSKDKAGVKPVSEVATIDAVSARRVSPTEYAIDINITVKDTSLTGLELFSQPAFPIGKIDNPRTGHYTISALAPPNPTAGAYRIELTIPGWRYSLPQFILLIP